jgi:hypothetical protein
MTPPQGWLLWRQLATEIPFKDLPLYCYDFYVTRGYN